MFTFAQQHCVFFRHLVALVFLTGALNACANQPQVHKYEYRPANGFVRIDPIEKAVPDNNHPASVSADDLRTILGSLKVNGTAPDIVPLFDGKELAEFVPQMTSALRKAGPKEDVAFVVAGKRGLLGTYSGTTYTTGRLFVSEGKINVIFGQAHERYEDRNGDVPSVLPIVLGSRHKRIEETWVLETAVSNITLRRPDWVMVGTNDVPPPARLSESQLQEIEKKLRLLDGLKQKGLVTEEEYRERRKAVLDGI